ncbi:RNA methyltransferase [Paenibacillus albiflavus]|uniref:RNA methyltransferase n=1 Tax=Paenibacillus albiflavus TaxID=2545760 RepID=A0A4R4ECT0_9BACL|nr:RNA methyltransferase [Paenibacillus albiflavus]TCZ77766.1 RNA methyltransferase [Paenibacillus albiflavus]
MNHTTEPNNYLYIYTCHEEERALCELELRTLFGQSPINHYVISDLKLDPSRSPFIKMRVALQYKAASIEQLVEQANRIDLKGSTFKVIYVETDLKVDYNEQRALEKKVGYQIKGKAEMRTPERLFGIAQIGGQWVLGDCLLSEPKWLFHNEKPQHYSTALSTRVARAVANIAVPDPNGVKAIDPCCGIGTVLIEALSMGIDIVGYDINPLAVRGARMNLNHFQMPNVVSIGDVRTLIGDYDAAIIDMPYNLCSVISAEEQLDMLKGVRKLASKAVVVTTETIDNVISEAGFSIQDRCHVSKGRFTRQILVCS